MAAKHEERVASALKSLSSDGLVLPTEDRHSFEALIEEFFDNDDDDDDTGSEDEQVYFLCIYLLLRLCFLSHRVIGKITKNTSNACIEMLKILKMIIYNGVKYKQLPNYTTK